MAERKTHITGQSLSQLAEALQPAIYEAGAKIMVLESKRLFLHLIFPHTEEMSYPNHLGLKP